MPTSICISQDPDSLLHENGVRSNEEHSPWQDSILRLYLPEGFILKLISEVSCLLQLKSR